MYVNAPVKPQSALALAKIEVDGGAGSEKFSCSLPIVPFAACGQAISLSLHFALPAKLDFLLLPLRVPIAAAFRTQLASAFRWPVTDRNFNIERL